MVSWLASVVLTVFTAKSIDALRCYNCSSPRTSDLLQQEVFRLLSMKEQVELCPEEKHRAHSVLCHEGEVCGTTTQLRESHDMFVPSISRVCVLKDVCELQQPLIEECTTCTTDDCNWGEEEAWGFSRAGPNMKGRVLTALLPFYVILLHLNT